VQLDTPSWNKEWIKYYYIPGGGGGYTN